MVIIYMFGTNSDCTESLPRIDPKSIHAVSFLIESLSVLPHSQFSPSRPPVPPHAHVPPNRFSLSLLHALPFCLYTSNATLNKIAIDFLISPFFIFYFLFLRVGLR